MPGLLDRSRCIAPHDYDRWRVPPAALAIHLSIGQVYAFSVFNNPLSRLIGITDSVNGDWAVAAIGRVFPLAIVVLGITAFMLGQWVERAGPRKAMFVSALCFGGGFLVAALGVQLHQLSIVYVGYGVLGGIGLGIGYLSPVSTLMKWFPDRPGMATGLALLGFGGGAMIGAPLAAVLMQLFGSPVSTGVAPTLIAMGAGYFAFMMFGVFSVRLPAPGWKPVAFTSAPIAERASGPIAPPVGRRAGRSVAERKEPAADVHVREALRTRQFWLLWLVLCLSATAEIGLLSQASPMIHEVFPYAVRSSAAAGFVGLLGLASMIGRFVWSASSDAIGRPRTYMFCIGFAVVLHLFVPTAWGSGNIMLFVIACALIMSLHGAAFATMPSYVRDTFGLMHLGAIHGRLLTAWSVAAVMGPALVTHVRASTTARGGLRADAYAATMYLMVAFLVVGFVSNWLVRPVHPRHFFQPPTGASRA